MYNKWPLPHLPDNKIFFQVNVGASVSVSIENPDIFDTFTDVDAVGRSDFASYRSFVWSTGYDCREARNLAERSKSAYRTFDMLSISGLPDNKIVFQINAGVSVSVSIEKPGVFGTSTYTDASLC